MNAAKPDHTARLWEATRKLFDHPKLRDQPIADPELQSLTSAAAQKIEKMVCSCPPDTPAAEGKAIRARKRRFGRPRE